MELTWYGQSCFRMTERAALAVVTDPYEAKGDALKLKADVVTVSRDDASHNNVNAIIGAQRGDVRKITGPGEYEIGGVFITGVAMKPDKKTEVPKTTVYAFNFDGLTVAHLGRTVIRADAIADRCAGNGECAARADWRRRGAQPIASV